MPPTYGSLLRHGRQVHLHGASRAAARRGAGEGIRPAELSSFPAVGTTDPGEQGQVRRTTGLSCICSSRLHRLEADAGRSASRPPHRWSMATSRRSRRARGSPGTRAKKAGRPSASRPARRSAACSTPWGAAGGAIRRVSSHMMTGSIQIDMLDALHPADHPRLRHERWGPAGSSMARRSACGSRGRSATRA